MRNLNHPSSHFNDAKMARVCLSFAPSSLHWGGRGIIVSFYSLQDCSYAKHNSVHARSAHAHYVTLRYIIKEKLTVLLPQLIDNN